MNKLNTIGIHFHSYSEKNDYHYAVTFNYGGNKWQQRSLQAKAIGPELCSRKMVFEEERRAESSWRMIFLSYKEARILLEDEFIITRDADWVKTIHKEISCDISFTEILISAQKLIDSKAIILYKKHENFCPGFEKNIIQRSQIAIKKEVVRSGIQTNKQVEIQFE